ADPQITNPEQFCSGPLRDQVPIGELHVPVLLGGLLKDRFDFLKGLVAILPQQLCEVALAVQAPEFPRQIRLFPAKIETLQAVVQETTERQVRRRLHVLVRVLRDDRAEEWLVLLAEAPRDALTERAKFVAGEVVALDKFKGSGACGVFAHEFDRPGGGVYLPDGQYQSV